MPWICRVLRKNCALVAGLLGDGEELDLELFTAEQNISVLKVALENLKCYIISTKANNPPNTFILKTSWFE